MRYDTAHSTQEAAIPLNQHFPQSAMTRLCATGRERRTVERECSLEQGMWTANTDTSRPCRMPVAGFLWESRLEDHTGKRMAIGDGDFDRVDTTKQRFAGAGMNGLKIGRPPDQLARIAARALEQNRHNLANA